MNRLHILVQRASTIQRCLPMTLQIKSTNLRTFKTLNNENKPLGTDPAATQKKKTIPKKMITLFGQNQTISVVSLEDAQKLAKRRDLHLQMVQALDPKTQRPVYKLVTPAEFLTEEMNDLKNDGKTSGGKSPNKKSEKTLTIGSRISEHDLASREKNICKWLVKQHEVRILIQGGPDDKVKMEQICKSIERSIKDPEPVGKIQQKRQKGAYIKFNILPLQSHVDNVDHENKPVAA